MSTEKAEGPIRGYQFSVDIEIESDSRSQALERLLRMLNNPDVKDFSIQKGLELGNTIEAAIEAALQQHKAGSVKKDGLKKAPDEPPSSDAKAPDGKRDAKKEPAAVKADIPAALAAEIERYKTNNTLVRITAVQGKGANVSIPCRILNYDAATQNVSVYHVDEKQVYLFRLNEIDDLHAV